jgi:ribosomal protein S20
MPSSEKKEAEAKKVKGAVKTFFKKVFRVGRESSRWCGLAVWRGLGLTQ